MLTNRRTLDSQEVDEKYIICALLVIVLNDTGIRPDSKDVKLLDDRDDDNSKSFPSDFATGLLTLERRHVELHDAKGGKP